MDKLGWFLWISVWILLLWIYGVEELFDSVCIAIVFLSMLWVSGVIFFGMLRLLGLT